MELVVKQIPKIEPIQFNFDELKEELTESVVQYKTMVYTADTIKEAKADRAKLNKLKKTLNDERIRLEKEYMGPFQDFKDKVGILCEIVDDASHAIDKQVKDYEELKKEEKRAQIAEIFQTSFDDSYHWLMLDQIWDEKWLNATCPVKKVEEAMAAIRSRIDADLQMLSRLPEYPFEAQETYKKSLKLDDALWQVDHLKQIAEAKKAAEAAAPQTEPQESEPVQVTMKEIMDLDKKPDMGELEAKTEICFRVYVTMEEAIKLSHFMKAEGIQFEKI